MYKVLVFVYLVMRDQASCCLRELLTRCQPNRRLGSVSSSLLSVLASQFVTHDDCCFVQTQPLCEWTARQCQDGRLLNTSKDTPF